MNKTNKIIIPMIVVIVAAIGIGVYVDSTAQVASLGQIVNSIEKIYPQTTPISERVTNVNGTSLTTIASSNESGTIDRTNGISKLKSETGRATLELQHGVQAGNNIIAATITNNGKDTIYLNSLIIFGQTSEGMEPLNAYIVDASYSPEVFGKIPKPAVVEPVAIISGESYTGYISGKWDAVGQPIQSFNVGAIFVYDVNVKEFVQDNSWSMSVGETKIP